MKGYNPEELFCIKYLKERNLLSDDDIKGMLDLLKEVDVNYKFVKVQPDFYHDLATELRKLWPAGEKDGKYPWRDSVNNLAARLEALWQIRQLGEYPIPVCLTVARRYLSNFENNAKYMKVLKYFILKQNKVVEANGHVKYMSESTFADMLERSETSDWENGDDLFTDCGNEMYEVR